MAKADDRAVARLSALGCLPLHAGTAKATARRGCRLIEAAERNPYLSHELTETGISGREYRVKLLPGFAITYWLDHYAREIQILRIKKITG